MATDSPQPPGDTLNFETAIQRLEEIAHLLEEGKIGLDEALARYEEGVGLLRKAGAILERAERRIELLTGVDAEGNPVTRPLEDVSTLSLQQAPESATSARPRRTRRTAEPGES